MSILKYTRKYLLYSLLTLVVICGVGALVYRQIEKEHVHDHEVPDKRVSFESTPELKGRLDKVTPKLKKKPKPSHSHDHPVKSPGAKDFEYPRDLQERLDKVSADGNSYYTNSNFFQELYDAVSDGRDMETTIEILKEYNIYTDVVLEYMEPYEAFQYALTAPTGYKGPALKYAERVFSENPSSPEGLEAGLYMARGEEDNFRRVLKYHPNSAMVLIQLGRSIEEERPSEAIVYLKRAAQLGQIGMNRLGIADHALGIAYQRLGDYKSAWIHFKRADALDGGHPRNQSHLEAIAKGKPGILPIQREPTPDVLGQGAAVPSQPPVDGSPASDFDVFVDAFVVPEDVPASVQVPERLSPEELARQDAKHQAFLEMLREQEEFTRRLAEEEQFKADYFREVQAFIQWVESIEHDSSIDTNNFMAKEMQRHLLGEKTRFAPDRLKRGFDFINKYGKTEGINRLQQLDPDLAKQLHERRVPPRRNPRDK